MRSFAARNPNCIVMKRFWILTGAAALLLSTRQLTAAQYWVNVPKPPGCIKYVRPEYPIEFARRGAAGRGIYLLKVNPKTGDVDEVKVVRRTPFKALDELAVRAFFQWKFQPGSPAQVKVPCEFYVTGFSHILH